MIWMQAHLEIRRAYGGGEAYWYHVADHVAYPYRPEDHRIYALKAGRLTGRRHVFFPADAKRTVYLTNKN